jgi:hypothetical protein
MIFCSLSARKSTQPEGDGQLAYIQIMAFFGKSVKQGGRFFISHPKSLDARMPFQFWKEWDIKKPRPHAKKAETVPGHTEKTYMTQTQKTSMLSDINSLEQTLSPERFKRYMCWADGDPHRALALYTLNTQLSESLYTPLHMLEIVLRNRIHSILAHAHGELWFQKSDFLLGQHQSKQLSDVTAEIRKTPKPVTAGKPLPSPKMTTPPVVV